MIRKEFSIVPSSGGGIPCMWEEGGATDEGNFAVIIADQAGGKPTAIYIPRIKQPCGQHALVPVRPGYFIVEVGLMGVTQIWRVIDMAEAHITAELVQEYACGRWSNLYAPINESVNKRMNEVIEVAWKKANDHNCREVYWVTAPRCYNKQVEQVISTD